MVSLGFPEIFGTTLLVVCLFLRHVVRCITKLSSSSPLVHRHNLRDSFVCSSILRRKIFVCVNFAHVVDICMGVVTIHNFRDIQNMPYISPGSYLDLEKCYRFIRSDLWELIGKVANSTLTSRFRHLSDSHGLWLDSTCSETSISGLISEIEAGLTVRLAFQENQDSYVIPPVGLHADWLEGYNVMEGRT